MRNRLLLIRKTDKLLSRQLQTPRHDPKPRIIDNPPEDLYFDPSFRRQISPDHSSLSFHSSRLDHFCGTGPVCFTQRILGQISAPFAAVRNRRVESGRVADESGPQPDGNESCRGLRLAVASETPIPARHRNVANRHHADATPHRPHGT
jgi:hypothetical protein